MKLIRLIFKWFHNLFHKMPVESQPEARAVRIIPPVRVIPYRGHVSLTPTPEVPDNFHPSPTMKVRFADGEVIPMRRKLRRFNHLYGDRLVKTRR